MSFIRNGIIFFNVIFLFSCSNNQNNYNRIIIKAGKNGKELQKVVDHYKSTKERKKTKAAYFLISNMEDKYGIYYSNNTIFLSFNNKVDSFIKSNDCNESLDNFISDNWLSYKNENPDISKPKIIKDYSIIKSDFLIKNIDLAFKVWEENPWAKHLNFNEFCEWILPYRINNEPIQDWRTLMYSKFKWLKDSLLNPNDPKEACQLINQIIAKNFVYSDKFNFIPMLGGIDAWNCQLGKCIHRYQLVTMAMRSVGLPVTIDYAPQYPGNPGGHSWMALLDSDHYVKSFNGGEKDIKFYYPAVCPIGEDIKVVTVYRRKYAKNNEALSNYLKKQDIPVNLRNDYVINVAHEYTGNRTSDIVIKLKDTKDYKYAFLYSFNYGKNVNPTLFSKISDGEVRFNNVGRGGIYFVAYCSNNKIIQASLPFLLPDPVGNIEYIKPDYTSYDNIRLYRKFVVKWTMEPFVSAMIGATIEGSNVPDFKNAEVLYTIKSPINNFQEFDLSQDKPYRYYRYKSSDSGVVRIAEIKLFSNTDSIIKNELKGTIFGYVPNYPTCDIPIFENAFDDDISTNLNAPVGSWVAMDLGFKTKISSFSILARNHLNIVEPGDLYELSYFDYGWHSLGIKTASEYYIDFEDIPSNSILLLQDLSKGKEERIFRINNGKQVFW